MLLQETFVTWQDISRYTMVLVAGDYNLNEHAIKKKYNYQIVTAIKVSIRVAFDCVA